MRENEHEVIMRARITLLAVLLLLSPVALASEGGVNEDSSLEGTDIDSISHETVSKEGVPFEISLRLLEEANQNGTTVDWVTQICVNSGVCYPPATQSLEKDESGNWTGAVIPDESATYLNWRFILHYEDGSKSTIPEAGWGWKVWSDCWYDNGSWGGPSKECQEDDESLPWISAPLLATSIAMAALMSRRD
tara:strand:+ start:105 stop:680 length:576 start_codon:yes stop_codon:yes gene_type:complete